MPEIPGWEGSIGPSKSQYGQPHVYARDVQSGAGNCVCGAALRHARHVQAAPGVPIPADRPVDPDPPYGVIPDTAIEAAAEVIAANDASGRLTAHQLAEAVLHAAHPHLVPHVPVVDPDAFDAYVVTSSCDVWLTCPREDCAEEVHESEPRPSDQQLTLGDLMGMADDHEAEKHGGYKPILCSRLPRRRPPTPWLSMPAPKARQQPGDPAMTRPGTLAIDFDGVVHRYSKGWLDGTIYDDPMTGAIDGLHALMAKHPVFIHTARRPRPVAEWLANHGIETCVEEGIAAPMEFWNERHRVLVTNRKLPAVAYLDDRAVRFTTWASALRDLLPDPSYHTAHERVVSALAAAWPHLADDPVHLDQLAEVALRAANEARR